MWGEGSRRRVNNRENERAGVKMWKLRRGRENEEIAENRRLFHSLEHYSA